MIYNLKLTEQEFEVIKDIIEYIEDRDVKYIDKKIKQDLLYKLRAIEFNETFFSKR